MSIGVIFFSIIVIKIKNFEFLQKFSKKLLKFGKKCDIIGKNHSRVVSGLKNPLINFVRERFDYEE